MVQRICFILMFLAAHSASAAEGMIIKLQKGTSVGQFQLQQNVKLQAISPEMGLYYATPLSEQLASHTRSAMRRSNSVVYDVPNHPVKLRASLPNDSLLSSQWGLNLSSTNVGINARAAFTQFGINGKDKSGHDVVVAVVDGGFDHGHADLVSNRWVNRREIAGNKKDDDGNGFVDDINGWNARANNGTIESADHGTRVASIIGARSGNSLGIAGVNGRVKVMFVSAGFGLGDTLTTMRAYSYILKQKQLFLQSGGTKGANVVAINSSFGIDEQKCSDPDFAVWNDMFDSLGEAGILSIAATANQPVNVDQVGDIPTSCDSPFVVGVTASGKSGGKASFAAFGVTHIDIAAPGEGILSAAQRTSATAASKYTSQNVDGTSFATPHVAGAIGYLHGIASLTFNKFYLQNPAEGALAMKEVLLDTVTRVNSLQGLTATGGVLNLQKAAVRLNQQNVLASLAQ